MFKRLFSSASKFPFYMGGISSATAIVALTDKELSKKPEWYQDVVHKLEFSLNKLGKYTPIENLEVLDQAQDILTRSSDYNSAEISWRLGRALIEKSVLIKDKHEKIHLLHEAVEHFHKAFSLEPSQGCAGAHKWYSVLLTKLKTIDKKHKAVTNANQEILEHLEKAVKIDPKDSFSWHYLGVHHFNNKNYKEAISALSKAEEIKPGFSATNDYYLGVAYRELNDSESAIKFLKKSLSQPNRLLPDGKAKLDSKNLLLNDFKQKWEEIDPNADY